jgi:hypothetical protein
VQKLNGEHSQTILVKGRGCILKKTLILTLFAVVLATAGARCAWAVNNKTDQFLAGRYGGVNSSTVLDTLEMKVVEGYGIDWFWLQHQGIIPMIEKNDPGVERLKKLVGRTRIIYRGWFLGSKNIDGTD